MPEVVFVAYDIKGIQQFIYSVPRLRYMIGGSGLISNFDESWRLAEHQPADAKLIFSGGGRGAFRCNGMEVAEQVRERLVQAAHKDGLDVRSG